MPSAIDEQAILDSLRRVPAERWGDVLGHIEALQVSWTPIRTGADVVRSGLVGLWADRDDIGDSIEFARSLRRQAEARGKPDDAPG